MYYSALRHEMLLMKGGYSPLNAKFFLEFMAYLKKGIGEGGLIWLGRWWNCKEMRNFMLGRKGRLSCRQGLGENGYATKKRLASGAALVSQRAMSENGRNEARMTDAGMH